MKINLIFCFVFTLFFELSAQVVTNPFWKNNNDSSSTGMSSNSKSSPEGILNRLNKGGYVITKNSTIPKKSNSSLNEVHLILNEISKADDTFEKQLTPSSSKVEVAFFKNAFKGILNMLKGNEPLSLKKAIYLTEGAYFGQSISSVDYQRFSKVISDMGTVCLKAMEFKKLDSNNDENINYIIYKYMSDTLEYGKQGGENKMMRSFPKRYDFNDPFGNAEITNLFVSKLMMSNSGQCKSLPLLYLLLVEELKGEAFLSFSPQHSYIKCKKKNGGFYNIELTNGMITTDAWVAASGYVKSGAIRSGIYLDTINNKQVVASSLVDLAKYYSKKYGEDKFVLKCVNESLKYFPNNIHALILKSNYYSRSFEQHLERCKATNIKELKLCKNAYHAYKQMHKMYALIEGVGHEEIPDEIYLSWLKEMEEKRESQENNFILK